MKTSKRSCFRKKRLILPALILLVLVVFRLYLPTLVKNYVNKTLANIPGYYGHVEDIDIALIRGAYVINGLYLNKVQAETQIPFLDFPKTDISVQWKALFQGKIVSEIYMHRPSINYVMEDQQKSTSTEKPQEEDWTKAITDLVPIDINHFEIRDGTITFKQVNAQPPIDLAINQLNLKISNLRNAKGTEGSLPSPVEISANTFGNGQMKIEGGLNLLRDIPDIDLSFSLQKADARALNAFTDHYAGLDFDNGTFELYSEMAIADAHLKGYIKPMLINAHLIGKEESFLDKLWEGFVGVFKFILKNQKSDTVATKIPFEGDLDDVNTSVWTTVGNTVKNAWIEAFQNKVDNEVNYKDAFKKSKK